MSGTLSQWEDAKLKSLFRRGVANGIGDGIAESDVRIESMAAGSVVIDFTIFQTSRYTGSRSIADRLSDPTEVAALSAAVEEETGQNVEEAVQVTSSVQVAADGTRSEQQAVLSSAELTAAIAAPVAFVVFAACCGCAAYWFFVKNTRKRKAQVEDEAAVIANTDGNDST